MNDNRHLTGEAKTVDLKTDRKNHLIRAGLRVTVFVILAVVILVWVNQPGGIFEVRWIAYLGQPLESPEVWKIAANGGGRQQLTNTGGQVVDFAVSADGKWIVYSVRNDQNGSDLFLVRRNGKGAKLLVSCGAERCDQPAWSPDSRKIANNRYNQINSNPDKSSLEQIWTVDVTSGVTSALIDDPAIAGRAPIFSHEGGWLAFYNRSAQAIGLYAEQTGEVRWLPTPMEETGAFSPDGTKLVYVSLQTGSLLPVGMLVISDLKANTSTTLLDADLANLDAKAPAWSSQGDWIAFSARSLDLAAGAQLWVVHPDGSGLLAVTQDVTANHAAADWSADGSMLAFQRLRLGSSDVQPEIMTWNLANGKSSLLVENAALPVWMP